MADGKHSDAAVSTIAFGFVTLSSCSNLKVPKTGSWITPELSINPEGESTNLERRKSKGKSQKRGRRGQETVVSSNSRSIPRG